MEPLVSIVTPSLNQAAFIERSILSVLNQDYPNIEYIVMDGGSTDGTLDILNKYNDRLTWVSEPDEGQSDAINKGFQKAHGEIITWLNCDDVYLPGAVRIAFQSLIEHPNVAMVYGGANYINDSGELTKRGRTVKFDLNRPCESIIPQPAAFFRKEVFEEVGGLDINLHYRMDLDLWIRIVSKFEVHHIPYTLVNIRTSLDAKTASTSEHHWKELSLIGKRYRLEAISSQYVLKQRALKYYYHSIMLFEDHQAGEARADLLEVIKLNSDFLTTLKATMLLVTSFLGTGLITKAFKWRKNVYSRRSNLRAPRQL